MKFPLFGGTIALHTIRYATAAMIAQLLTDWRQLARICNCMSNYCQGWALNGDLFGECHVSFTWIKYGYVFMRGFCGHSCLMIFLNIHLCSLSFHVFIHLTPRQLPQQSAFEIPQRSLPKLKFCSHLITITIFVEELFRLDSETSKKCLFFFTVSKVCEAVGGLRSKMLFD